MILELLKSSSRINRDMQMALWKITEVYYYMMMIIIIIDVFI